MEHAASDPRLTTSLTWSLSDDLHSLDCYCPIHSQPQYLPVACLSRPYLRQCCYREQTAHYTDRAGTAASGKRL